MTQYLPGVRPEPLSGPGHLDPEPPVDRVDAADNGDFPAGALHRTPLSPLPAPPVVRRYWLPARTERAALLAAIGAVIIAIVVLSALIARNHFRDNTVAVPPPLVTETPVSTAPPIPGVPLDTAPPGVSPTVTPPPLPPQATVPAPPVPVASSVLPPPPPPPVLRTPPPAVATPPPPPLPPEPQPLPPAPTPAPAQPSPPPAVAPPTLPQQPVNTPVPSPAPPVSPPAVAPPPPAPTTNPPANNGVSLRGLQLTDNGGRFAGMASILNASGHPVRSGNVQITLRNGSTVVGVLDGTIANVANGATTTIPVSSNNAFSSGNFTAELAVSNLS